MARKRFYNEDILSLLRQIGLNLNSGSNAQTARCSTGVCNPVYIGNAVRAAEGNYNF